MIAAGVVLLHAAALWALQSARLQRPPILVVPVTIVSEQVTPPAPLEKAAPPAPEPKRPAPPPARTRLTPAPAQAPAAKPRPKPAAAPTQSAAPAPTPSVDAPALPSVDAPAAPMAGAPGSDSAGARGPAGPASTGSGVELPSSGAGYLQNPPPVYPAISKRLGEQGKVLVRVLIGADGNPQTAEIKRSSGFDRLDRSALEYVMKCRYVPGKVGGIPQAMWYEAPVSFVLQ